jgi:hypothetical protein
LADVATSFWYLIDRFLEAVSDASGTQRPSWYARSGTAAPPS